MIEPGNLQADDPAGARRRRSYRRDAEAILDYYLATAGDDVALNFVDALEAATQSIAAHPATGSPRYGQALTIPGLRHKRLARFPYLVFYVDLAGEIELWRILHGERDLPALLAEED